MLISTNIQTSSFLEKPNVLLVFHLLGFVRDFKKVARNSISADHNQALNAIERALVDLTTEVKDKSFHEPLDLQQKEHCKALHAQMQGIFYPQQHQLDQIDSTDELTRSTREDLERQAKDYKESLFIQQFERLILTRIAFIELYMQEHVFVANCANQEIIPTLIDTLISKKQKIMRHFNITDDKFNEVLRAFKLFENLQDHLALSHEEMELMTQNIFALVNTTQEKILAEEFLNHLGTLSEMTYNTERIRKIYTYLMQELGKNNRNNGLVKTLNWFGHIFIKPTQQTLQYKMKLREISTNIGKLEALYNEKVVFHVATDNETPHPLAMGELLGKLNMLSELFAINGKTTDARQATLNPSQEIINNLNDLRNWLEKGAAVNTSGILKQRVESYIRFVEREVRKLDAEVINIEIRVKSLPKEKQDEKRASLMHAKKIEKHRALLAENTADILSALRAPNKENTTSVKKSIMRTTNFSANNRRLNNLGRVSGSAMLAYGATIAVAALFFSAFTFGVSLFVGAAALVGIGGILGFSIKSSVEKRRFSTKVYDRSMKVLDGISHAKPNSTSKPKIKPDTERQSVKDLQATRLSHEVMRMSGTNLLAAANTPTTDDELSDTDDASSEDEASDTDDDEARLLVEYETETQPPSQGTRTADSPVLLELEDDSSEDEADEDLSAQGTQSTEAPRRTQEELKQTLADILTQSGLFGESAARTPSTPAPTPITTPATTPVVPRHAVQAH